MSWTVVVAGFDEANETINFGNRIVSEESLYEISTLATISCEEQNDKNPSIYSKTQNGRFYLAIDTTFHIFSENCSNQEMVLCTEAKIDCFCISSDNNLVIFCLANGELQCLDKKNCTLIFQVQIEENLISEEYFVSIYRETQNEINFSFIITCKNGKIYRLMLKNIPFLYEQITQNEEITVDPVIDEICDFNFDININCFDEIGRKLYAKGEELAIYEIDDTDGIFLSEKEDDLVKIYDTGVRSLLIGLNSAGYLFGVLPNLLIKTKLFCEQTFQDIIYFQDENESYILALTNPDKEGDSFVQLYSFPKMNLVFTLNVSENIYFSTPSSRSEELIFIDAEKNGDGIISQLRIKVINECEPNTRLKRILKRNRLDEAEKFAIQYNLNLDPVWRARANVFIEKLKCTNEDLEELIQILNKIKDVKFVAQCCNEISFATLDGIRKLYDYVLKRIRKSMTNNPDDKRFWKLLNQTMKILSRLDTFILIHQKNFNNTNYNQIAEWETFSQLNFLQHMENFLQNGQITESILIFSKLDKETRKMLSIEKIEEILYLLPTNIDIMHLIPWLRNFFIFAITTLPKSLNVFIKWLYDNLIRLEKDSNYEWPQYALDFAEKILSVLSVNDNEFMSMYFSLENSENILKQVSDIIGALKDIQVLDTQFGIKISLETYKMDPKNVIEDLLNLATVSRDGIHNFIDKFLKNYITKHKLCLDVVLTNYIDKMTNFNSRQDIITEILPCISSTTKRLENIKVILNRAKVPWTETITNIAKNAVKESHSLTKDIQYIIDNMPIQILIKKYFKNDCINIRVSDKEDLIHIVKIILKSNYEDKFKDIEVLENKFPDLKKYFSFLTNNYHLRNKNYANTFKNLDTFDEKTKLKCSEHILNSTRSYIKLNNEISQNYIETLDPITKKLLNDASYLKQNDYRLIQSRIRSLNILKTRYNVETSNLKCMTEKLSLLSDLVAKIYREVELQHINWTEACKNVQEISQCIFSEVEIGLFELIKQSKSLTCMICVGEIFLEKNEIQITALCKLAALLFKHMCDDDTLIDFNEFSNPPGDTSLSTSLNATLAQLELPTASQNYYRALKLSHELTLRATTMASDTTVVGNDFYLPIALDMLNWISTIMDMHISEEDSTRWSYSPMYYPEVTIPPPFCVMSIVRDIFCMYLDFVKYSTALIHNSTIGAIIDNDNEQSVNKPIDVLIEQHINSLQPKIQQLHNEGYDLTAFHILQVLKSSFRNLYLDPVLTSAVKNALSQTIKIQCIYRLLEKILTMKKVDETLAISFLLCIGPSVKDDWINCTMKKYRMDINKFSMVVDLALRCAELFKFDTKHKEGYQFLKTRCKWWKKCFSKFSKYTEHFQIPETKLAKLLISSNEINLDILDDFCKDFHLDIQQYLPMYLYYLLSNWKPEIEVVCDGDQKNITVKNCEKELFQKCYKIVVLINDKRLVYEQLQKTCDQISYYAYEVYLCIFEILFKLDPNHDRKKDILYFLKTYTRISKPQQREIEDWEKDFTTEFDPLSEYRLPFLPEAFKTDVWRFLKPEINLDTYLKWFDAAEILNLDKNDICTYAIKGTISSGLFKINPNIAWQLRPTHDKLLEQISECVSHMTNLEQACAVLYQCVLSCPGGHDQMVLATKCWEICQLWASNDEQCTPDSLEKVQRKYISCCTEHILHSHQLGDEKYLKLLLDPKELIQALYLDDRIIQRSRAVILHCPDINTAVEQIAELHLIDIQETRMCIIKNLLQPKSALTLKSDFSFTTTNLFSSKQNDIEDSEDDALIRVCYICQSLANSAPWAKLLFEMGMVKPETEEEEDEDSLVEAPPTLSVRVRALRCLTMMTNGEVEIENIEDFGDYLKKLQLLERLESIGVGLDLEQLDNCDKYELVKKLGQSHGHNPKAVAIMASISHQFELGQPWLWEIILRKFIQLSMITELKIWLPKLKDYGQLTSGSTYLAAWNKLIDSIFGNSRLQIEQDTQQILQGFLLLQNCPITSNLNLVSICERCIQVDKPEFAALLFPYLLPSAQSEVIQKLAKVDLTRLQDRINYYGCQGVITANFVLELLSNF